MNITANKRVPQELIRELQKFQKSQPEKSRPYPTDSKLDEHMGIIHDYKFKTEVDAYGRECCRMIAKYFTGVIPYVDRYAVDIVKGYIEEGDLERHYRNEWFNLDEGYKNKIRRAARRYNDGIKQSITQLQEFCNRQAYHLDKMEDETVGSLLDFDEHEILDPHKIESYITLATAETGVLWPSQALSRELIRISKGAIYFDKNEVAKELRDREYKELKRGRKSLGFYVKFI